MTTHRTLSYISAETNLKSARESVKSVLARHVDPKTEKETDDMIALANAHLALERVAKELPLIIHEEDKPMDESECNKIMESLRKSAAQFHSMRG